MLTRTLRTPRGATLAAEITHDGEALVVQLRGGGRLSPAAAAHAVRAVGVMFQIDFDLAPFYRRIRRDPARRWMADRKAGRMLRGETFFEDVVKMILTTNCSWALTTAMNNNLVRLFGGGAPGDARGFPGPESIAASSERELRERAKLGYRAPYVLEFSRRCANGSLDIEAFRASNAPTAELYAGLRAIKGVGDYAASNLLKLLGRFDYLGLDSWCRMKYAELHNGGVRADDADIERHYAPFEEWKGLVMWLEVTRDWYFEKFPFTKSRE